MAQMRSMSGHHILQVTREGVPLEPRSTRTFYALGSVGAIFTLILTVVIIAYVP